MGERARVRWRRPSRAPHVNSTPGIENGDYPWRTADLGGEGRDELISISTHSNHVGRTNEVVVIQSIADDGSIGELPYDGVPLRHSSGQFYGRANVWCDATLTIVAALTTGMSS